MNQRGFTGQGTDQYCIDRWKIVGTGTVIPQFTTAHALAVSSGTVLQQRMEIIPAALLGKSAVFAYENVDISGVNTYTVPITFPYTEPTAAGTKTYITATCEDLGIEIGIMYEADVMLCGEEYNTVPYITITNNSNSALRIRRVWLELGNVCHMKSTPPLDYASNLMICQRYYYNTDGMRWCPGDTGASNKNPRFTYAIPVSLRTTPTVAPSYNTFYAMTSRASLTISNPSISRIVYNNNTAFINVYLDTLSTALTVADSSKQYIVCFVQACLEISADL